MGAMMSASRRLQDLIDQHPALIESEVEANKLATLAESTTRTSTLADDRVNGIKRSVAEYDAIVAKACLDERYKADLAKRLRESNKLAVDSAMAQLSALQSLSSSMREEMRLARVGEGP
jgi:hypothetical protein